MRCTVGGKKEWYCTELKVCSDAFSAKNVQSCCVMIQSKVCKCRCKCGCCCVTSSFSVLLYYIAVNWMTILVLIMPLATYATNHITANFVNYATAHDASWLYLYHGIHLLSTVPPHTLAADCTSHGSTSLKTLGAAGYRSPYLSHAKRALYHLSYSPIPV